MPRVHSQRSLAVAVLAFVLLIAMPAVASAAPAVTSVTPPDGGTASGTWNPAVTVQLSADCTLSPSVTVQIDAKVYSRPVTYATSGYMDWSSGSPVWVVTRDYTRGSASLSSSPLAPGTHTIVTLVTDVLGGSSTRTTSFTLVPPTVLSSPRPAPGSVVTTDLPEVSVAIDPRYVPQAGFTVDGRSVSWRYDAAGKRIGWVPQALSNAATHTASVRWFDGAGRESTLSWSFRTQFTCFTQITNMTPAEGAIVADPVPITFVVSDPVGISGAATLLVDGTPATVTTAAIATGKSMRVTMAGHTWSEGTHTVVAAAWDKQGSSTSRAWSFKGALPLRLSSLTPANGSFVPSATPRLSVDVSTSVGGVVGTFTVGAITVPGVFDAARGRLVATSPALADETRYTLRVTARDASAKTVTLSSTFTTRLYTSGPSAECVICHAGYPSTHPVDDCDSCHHHGAFYGQKCTVCHASRTPHDSTMVYRALCTDCHGVGDPYVPQHPADLDGAHADPPAFDDCSACHVRALNVEHPRHTDGAATPYDCFTCHAPGARQQVRDAITAMDSSCDACHAAQHVQTGSFPGGALYGGTKHATTTVSAVAAVRWPGSSLAPGSCANCHGNADQPARPTGNALCAGCHDAAGTTKPTAYSYQGQTRYAASAHGTSPSASPCDACHAPHGATNASGSLLPAALKKSDPQACTGTQAQPGCHASGANAAHGTNVLAALTATANASAHHDVNASSGSHVVCSSCHNPHRDTASSQYSDPSKVGTQVASATDRFRDSSGRVFALVGAQHDALPPTISNFTITSYSWSPTTAYITWNTNEAANGWLQYGPTTSYGTTMQVSYAPTTYFPASLAVSVGTTYHMRANVADQMGNRTLGTDGTFRVPWTYLTQAPAFSGGSGGVHVSALWKTLGACGSWIDYGPTTAYGSTAGSATNDTTHSVTLPHLDPGTYHMRARSTRDGDVYTGPDTVVVVYSDYATAPVVAPISSMEIGAATPITFGWTQPNDTYAPFQYRLVLTGTVATTTPWQAATSTVLTLDEGTYNYTVEAKDKDGTDYPLPAVQTFSLTYPSSSCPNLFTWNGSEYDYVTDVMGLGPIGVRKSATTYMKAEPVEDTVIPPGKLAAKDGSLDIRLTDERNEIEFVDEVRLRAVDHPVGTRLLINDLHWGVADGGRAATEYHTIAGPETVPVTYERLPVLGTQTVPPTDISDKTAVEGDGEMAYAGLYDDNRWVFDLGELKDPEKIKLVVTGWVDYADKLEKAAWVASRKTAPKQCIEVQDADGNWVEIGDAPHPPGYTKTVVYDLTDKFPAGVTHYRVRMRMYMRMNLDWAAVDTSPDRAVKITELAPASADLSFKGRSAYSESPYPTFDFYRPGSSDPGGQSGAFTKLGDVTSLLQRPDDMYVVMNTGDDLAVSFDEPAAPAAGMERTYVIHTDGYHQTVTGKVDPMPFHAMSDYPYPADEHYPDDVEHSAYRATYNTRLIGSEIAAAVPDAVERLKTAAVPHAMELPPPPAPAINTSFSVDTDWVALQIDYPGSTLVTNAKAGWHSSTTTLATLPTPASPGSSVPATMLALTTSINSQYWRTDLTAQDRAYNWQVMQFNVNAASLTGAKSFRLRWWGHGEPTAGYPTLLYLWDFQAGSWVKIREFVSGADVSIEHTERQAGLEAFCITCHRAAPPAGAGSATAYADMASGWSVDRHGDGSGTGSGGALAAPYARGNTSIACDVCHDSHGNSNIYHIKPTINAASGIVVTKGNQFQNACVGCHTGTVADWHYGACNSCHWNADHASGRTIDGSYDCSACHKHGYVWAHPDMGCHGCADPAGAAWQSF